MAKLKNESQLLKKAMEVGENYAKNRGYANFASTDSSKDKTECLYRLLVNDQLIQPLAIDQENGVNMKHKLALWIARQLPKDHPLLQ
ncbi:MAG: DUF5062 family protein [Methylobacter sp.]|uniref:DUF5062 family protein n=2 Tax=Methylobacter TaxID=429 RepID=A0AA43TLH4_9GAMM|nr:DUF5062 family protein [Candidatus Methylobacter titanis]MDI1292998.1 DUF5062 family protein [Candidatus Methylobacter titanis]